MNVYYEYLFTVKNVSKNLKSLKCTLFFFCIIDVNQAHSIGSTIFAQLNLAMLCNRVELARNKILTARVKNGFKFSVKYLCFTLFLSFVSSNQLL